MFKSEDGKKKWKWSDCGYSVEKNKDRKCFDFKIQSFVVTITNKIILFFMQAGEQLPPTFKREKWWET